MKMQRALISVSDKTGVVELARALASIGVEILSTGGTAKAIRDAGLAVKDVSEFTGFVEILDGRVKTLHPKVHAGLLYVRGNPEHEATMKKHGLMPIDLVCVNLYPFEATVAKPRVKFDDAIENIDIGGPSMLRSAAKNHKFVTVVTDPADYGRVLASIQANGGNTDEDLRRELAQKVYARTAQYDAAIAGYLASQIPEKEGMSKPVVLAWPCGAPLRYGENPHQEAYLFKDASAPEAAIAFTRVLHGKEMSYNNYVDGDAALEAVKELAGKPGAAIIKHSNPCGYATGQTLAEALEMAWAGDTVSSYGSVIAVTVPVDLAAAEVLKGRFVEALIAPEFAPDALEFLKTKSKEIRLLQLHKPVEPAQPGKMIRHINGGLLLQDRDVEEPEQWAVATEQSFPEEKRALAQFGIKACKHVKSNAIVIVREYKPGCFMLLGMGAGQPNRVDALKKLAVTKARENIALLLKKAAQYGQSPKDFESGILGESVLVSDAFFPFPDNIDAAAEASIRYIVQPGGSKKDEEIISACDKLGIAMVLTGVRHFKH
ncbi:MAG: bifunctional phosphoribosylaminoimidazolecarboxamide formyltransferase/IMP cyclohydrolase [Verrucomicrobiota bacterium]